MYMRYFTVYTVAVIITENIFPLHNIIIIYIIVTRRLIGI